MKTGRLQDVLSVELLIVKYSTERKDKSVTDVSKYSTRKRLHRPVVLEYNLAVKNVKIVSKLATLRQSFRFCQHSPNIFKYNDERLQMFPGTIFIHLFSLYLISLPGMGEGTDSATNFFTPIYIGVLTPNMSGSIITNQKT